MIPTIDTPYFTDDHQHGWEFTGGIYGDMAILFRGVCIKGWEGMLGTGLRRDC